MFCVCRHLRPWQSSLLPMTSLLGTACPAYFRQARCRWALQGGLFGVVSVCVLRPPSPLLRIGRLGLVACLFWKSKRLRFLASRSRRAGGPQLQPSPWTVVGPSLPGSHVPAVNSLFFLFHSSVLVAAIQGGNLREAPPRDGPLSGCRPRDNKPPPPGGRSLAGAFAPCSRGRSACSSRQCVLCLLPNRYVPASAQEALLQVGVLLRTYLCRLIGCARALASLRRPQRTIG